MIDPPHGRNCIAETLRGVRLRYFDTMADYIGADRFAAPIIESLVNLFEWKTR